MMLPRLGPRHDRQGALARVPETDEHLVAGDEGGVHQEFIRSYECSKARRKR